MLVIESVGKTYRGGLRALDAVSLSLGPGLVGLLGPNCAGKSTLMRILATVSKPTTGRVLWEGEDIARRPDRLRAVLGYLPQDFGLYPNLSAVEFLDYLAAARGLPAAASRRRIEELLTLVNLTEAARRPLGGYSGGMKQRLGIAQALLNDPKLLIVDEPTVGLDPEERSRFKHLLSELAGDRVILLSTHIVSDIEAIAGTIALLRKGRLVAHDDPAVLVERARGRVWEMTIPAAAFADVRRRWPVSGARRAGGDLVVRLVAAGPPDAAARPAAPTLEDAYLDAMADGVPAAAQPA
jgi:ABC-2 type transport system ATP-binding protein